MKNVELGGERKSLSVACRCVEDIKAETSLDKFIVARSLVTLHRGVMLDKIVRGVLTNCILPETPRLTVNIEYSACPLSVRNLMEST